jgi:hypothetical protein
MTWCRLPLPGNLALSDEYFVFPETMHGRRFDNNSSMV